MLDLARIAPGQRVLVVGTGFGEDALEATHRVGTAGEVVATDASHAMIAEARVSVAFAKVANVRYLVMDAQDLKFKSGTFDAVISRNTLMFIPDLALALTEMNRVLKPKGRLAVTVWASARRNPRLSDPLAAMRALGVNPPLTATFRIASRLGAPSSIGNALRGAGFFDVLIGRWPVVARYDTVSAARATNHGSHRNARADAAPYA
jgi:SAM-dependent methyltransferase